MNHRSEFTRLDPLHDGLEGCSGTLRIMLFQRVQFQYVVVNIRARGCHLLFAVYVHPRQLDEPAALRET